MLNCPDPHALQLLLNNTTLLQRLEHKSYLIYNPLKRGNPFNQNCIKLGNNGVHAVKGHVSRNLCIVLISKYNPNPF